MDVNGGDAISAEHLRDKLQSLIGSSPAVKIEKFENWVGGQSQDWVFAVRPVTVTEVQLVVKAARALGLKVKGAASTHSWSPIFSDRGQIVVYVQQLQRNGAPRIQLLQDQRYPGSLLVTMVTGVTTGEFMNFQLENNVCIPSNVVLRTVTMGGVIAGGCHGAGLNEPTISDYVVSMRIVNSDGNLMEYSDVIDPEIMQAARCNLGLFGIMIDFTIKIQPMMYVETQNVWTTVGNFLYDKKVMREMVSSNWSVEVLWFPFNSMRKRDAASALVHSSYDITAWDPKEDELLLRIINQVGTEGSPLDQAVYDDEDLFVYKAARLLGATDQALLRNPQTAITTGLGQTGFLKRVLKKRVIQRLPRAVHYFDYVTSIPIHDMEWALHGDKKFENPSIAAQKTVEIVQKEALEGKFPLNMVLEMRFVGSSNAYLTPNFSSSPSQGGPGHTCHIQVISLYGTPGWEDFCRKVAYVWRHLPGAKPHWCKEWAFLPQIEQFLRKAYREEFQLFLSALSRSGADPEGVFLNSTLERLLFPEGHPGRFGRALEVKEPDPKKTIWEECMEGCSIL